MPRERHWAWPASGSSSVGWRAGATIAAAVRSHTRVVVAIALCAFTLLAWQPLQCARAYAARDACISRADFGRPARRQSCLPVRTLPASRTCQLPEPYRRPGDTDSVRLEFKPGATPGLQVFEPYPDWRNHDVLVLDVTNPSPQPAQFMLRILDATHDWSHADRFNQPIVIPGAARTTIRISLEAVATSPARRRMDMGAIANVMLFARQPLDTDELYVTRIWLE